MNALFLTARRVIEAQAAFFECRRLVADMPTGKNFELDISEASRALPPADLLPEKFARSVPANDPRRIKRAEFGWGRLLPQDTSLAHHGGHKLIADVQPRMGTEERGIVVGKFAARVTRRQIHGGLVLRIKNR